VANCKRQVFGAFVLILIALIPTLLYVYIVYTLGMPEGNLDLGCTLGSYFGLLFLVGSYTAIGIFTSTLSDNQIVAFLLSVFYVLCSILAFKEFRITSKVLKTSLHRLAWIITIKA